MAAEALHWHARVDDPQSEHGPTTYRVFITTNVPAYSSSLTPIVSRRRYTEFCELRDCLAERQATEGVPCTLPLMPPKKLWSTAPGVVSTRCAVFEELLNAIGKDERLRLLPVVAAFVCAQARGNCFCAQPAQRRSLTRHVSHAPAVPCSLADHRPGGVSPGQRQLTASSRSCQATHAGQAAVPGRPDR